MERLRRFRRADPDVLAEIYRTYRMDLARCLSAGFTFRADDRWFRFHGVTAPFDLDDLIQETFVRAFSESSRTTYDGVRPFGAWLTVIARNLVVDRWRRAERDARLVTELRAQDASGFDGLGEKSAAVAEPERRLEHAELQAVYQRFVDGLPSELKVVWQLRFEERSPRNVVSNTTGLSSMQLRWRERKLQKAFIEFFAECGFEGQRGVP